MEALNEDMTFGPEDAQMLDHIVDVIGDRMHNEDGYTEADEETLKRLERLRDACRTERVLGVLVLVMPPQTEPDGLPK